MKNRKLPSRLLALALCLCMVLGLMPMMPLVAEAATVPNYISSIGISQDGSSGSTGVNDCKRELDGHTIIDVDLNDEAGGDYVYMGYKTTTDPAQAITGILFRVGKNRPIPSAMVALPSIWLAAAPKRTPPNWAAISI